MSILREAPLSEELFAVGILVSAHQFFNNLLVSRLFLALFHCSLLVQDGTLPPRAISFPGVAPSMVRRIGCWIGLALLVGACSGCGVLYTVVKSESKLDRLAVPMTKAEVDRPDRPAGSCAA